jgi:hypothetical protein
MGERAKRQGNSTGWRNAIDIAISSTHPIAVFGLYYIKN